MFSLNELFFILTGQDLKIEDLWIPHTEVDSRKILPGSMFVASRGGFANGHDFLGEAIEKGMNLALIDEDVSDREDLKGYHIFDLRKEKLPVSVKADDFEFPFFIRVDDSLKALQKIAKEHIASVADLTIIGITGSVGKSSTKELLAEVLRQRFRVHKNKGNYNSETGLPLTALQLNQNHEVVVFEMGFFVPGDINFLCEIAPPKIGIVTNVGMVHAERAGSQEEIAKGKAELVQNLPKDGLAILNYDDLNVRVMAEKTKARVLFYGFTPEADIYADRIEGMGLKGMRFMMHYQGESMFIHLPILGRHSVQTALCAAAVGFELGLTWKDVIRGLSFGHTQLRLIVMRSQSGALLLDDSYNASPQSTMAALNLLDELEGRKVAVLGDMLELGIYEKESHYKIGVRAGLVADELVTVGKCAERIALAAGQNGLSEDKIHCFETPEEATLFLQKNLTEQDIVLVKGSLGMRMWTIIPALEKNEVSI